MKGSRTSYGVERHALASRRGPRRWAGGLTVLLIALWQLTGVAGLSAAAEPAAVGAAAIERGPEWWKANKRHAVFVPGKGYSIEGVPGFYDENGMPIRPPVRSAPIGVGHVATMPPPLVRAESEAEPSVLDRLNTAIGRGPDQSKAKQLVQQGNVLLQEKEFSAASAKFAKAATHWPDSALAEEAQFLAAECQFFADRYPQAVDAFTAFLKDYPGSQRLDDAITRLFAIARYWQEYDQVRPHWPITPNLVDKTRRRFDTHGHSLKVYETIRMADPTGPRADDALMATATAYFAHGRYDDADYHFGLLRREYPKSEFQFEAHLLGLQCKLRKYQGPDYDGKPLEEAAQLVEQLLSQFPDRVADERPRIMKMRAEVAAQLALRDWSMAEYYDNGKHYAAARYYYRRLAEDHPQTRLASAARDRLAAIDGQPDSPTRLAWLTNLFSTERVTSREESPAPGTPAEPVLRR
jgi:outer membrane protein assembly factor BamD (BamD/ComL family)